MSKRPAIVEAFAKCEVLLMDFDGVFTDNTSSVGWAELYDPSPYAKRRYRDERCVCSHADGLGLSRMREVTDIPCLVITSQIAGYVAARCEKLNLEVVNVERSMGGEGNLARGKMKILQDLVKRFRIGTENICFVGNDAPDVDVLLSCGLSVAVADSEPAALMAAKYVTEREGGCGALRDVCDLILHAKTGQLGEGEWYEYGVSDIG